MRCSSCGAELPAKAERCVRCGGEAGEKATATQPPLPRQRVVDTRWFVLLVIFGALAGFGLPLLWYSRGFSRSSKVFWTIVVSLYTALVVWLIWIMLLWLSTMIRHEFHGSW